MIIGGIAGSLKYVSIENCYVTGIDICDSEGVTSGIGGIAGRSTSSNSIKNCYAEGKINSKNLNVGGIIGYVETDNIESCYSKVRISTENNNLGGIVGLYSGNVKNIINNLSIGDLYTTSGTDSLNRIVGTSQNTNSNNYAYENQLLNGYVSREEKGATLLSKKEILDLNLGESYNYDGKNKGILPKLYNIEGTELLPNQKDILIDDNDAGSETINLSIERVEATKPNTTEAEISVIINNPNEVEITGIEIEDMTVSSITRNVTQNGMTSITVRVTPNRYYDSYKLTGIKYKALDNTEQIKEVEAEIEVQFYKEIYTYEDWQSIEEGTYQNYRLMADIDFTGRTNIKNNITVNRLEAENNVYTLKNITLEYNTANTGLINNVKTGIKNIGFENINLSNSAGSGSYFGVIASNNGNIENLKFSEILIDGNGINYVGLIGNMNAGNVDGVEIKDVTIKGKDYTGGAIGYLDIGVNASAENISGDNITIEASGNRVGGLIGYMSGNTIEANNLSVSNSNISGKDYVGGAIGYLNFGNINYIKVNSTNISGNSYVGGNSGYIYSEDGNYYRKYLQTESSTINGTGNYIGGITGWWDHGINTYITVNNSIINANSIESSYIGGILGASSWCSIQNFQINNSKILSNGNNIGGLGNCNSGGCGIYNGYIQDTDIQGNNSVGGLLGSTNYCTMNYIYLKVDVKANSHTAGGLIGYLDNINMTAAQYKIEFYSIMVLDSDISAPTKAGGLIGDIAKEIYRNDSFYEHNYVDANVTSENSSTGSLIIGGRPDENPYITTTFVYKYSKLNEDYVYASNDNINDNQYLVRADLDKSETFSNKIGLGTVYAYDSVAEGKYPKISDTLLYKPELQTGIDLPTDPDITIINSLDDINTVGNKNNLTNTSDISTQSIEALPTITAYPVSVNEINIDFSSMPEGVEFTYYVNGKSNGDGVALAKKTYTFNYNYQDTLEIKLTNGQEENSITISPDKVRSEASLVGGDNAYTLGTSLYINGELQQGEYVNLYGGYALDKNGQMLDMTTKQLSNSDETITTLSETTKPLHTYNYKDSNIEVYGTYSKINDNIKSQIYNVRSGILSALSSNTDMKIDNSITDNYNNKEYQTILKTSGELVDLKEKLQYPSNFLSSNIKQIVQNQDAEKPEMMVLYNTGKVIVFNYVNGNIIYENNEKADTGLVSYLTRSIANIWNDYEDKQQEYEKSKELETKLAKLPVEEALKESNKEIVEGATNNLNISTNNISTDNTNNMSGNSTGSNNSNNPNNSNTSTNTGSNSNTTSDSDYITVYNENTGEYEVYSEDEILNGEEENPVSETEKIKQNGLEGIYGYNSKQEETKPQANGAIIVVVIIVVAIISLVVLRKIVYKNNQKSQGKQRIDKQ